MKHLTLLFFVTFSFNLSAKTYIDCAHQMLFGKWQLQSVYHDSIITHPEISELLKNAALQETDSLLEFTINATIETNEKSFTYHLSEYFFDEVHHNPVSVLSFKMQDFVMSVETTEYLVKISPDQLVITLNFGEFDLSVYDYSIKYYYTPLQAKPTLDCFANNIIGSWKVDYTGVSQWLCAIPIDGDQTEKDPIGITDSLVRFVDDNTLIVNNKDHFDYVLISPFNPNDNRLGLTDVLIISGKKYYASRSFHHIFLKTEEGYAGTQYKYRLSRLSN